jgi:hypothetical protein
VSRADAQCFLCVGKDCRRDDGYQELVSAVAVLPRVRHVKCQDLCGGPVAGVVVDGRVEWFEKLRKGKHRAAIVELASGATSKVPSVLRSSWARKRSGKFA